MGCILECMVAPGHIFCFPKYATHYVVHKEAVRQDFLDSTGSFLFKHKKATYLPIPFRLESYRFSKVKKSNEFIQELEKFHFGEISFHRNDSQNKEDQEEI